MVRTLVAAVALVVMAIAPSLVAAQAKAAPQTSAKPPVTGTININTASAAELESIPRIGPKTAEVIVKFREDNGPFRRVEHLMQVRGISEKRFNEIRPYLRTE